MPKPLELSIDQTKLVTWFERDRAQVELVRADTEETIVEWRDEQVSEAIEDGFLTAKGFVLGRLIDPKPLHRAAYKYAQEIGRIA